jgi:HlyD family secretion protein
MKARTIAWIAGGVAAAGAAAWLVARPEAVPVEVAVADRGSLRVTVDGTGKTRVRDRFEIAAPAGGQLERITLRPGDPVARGDVVARIVGPSPAPLDPRARRELEARLAAARAAEIRAQAGLEQARVAAEQAVRDLERALALGKAAVVSESDVELARTRERARHEEVHMAEASLRQASAEVSAATAALGLGGSRGRPVEVRSPAAGTVLRVLRESGGPLPAGAPLLDVGDTRRLEVVADLPSADAVRVSPGDAGTVSGWGGGHALAARVRRVEPAGFTKVSPLGVEEQRVNVLLDPAGEGWEALGDAFSVDVSIAVQVIPDAVRIPASAVFRDGEGWAVFAVEGGRARLRPVSVLASSGGTAAVDRGVAPGDRVVLYPGDRIADGVRLAVD